MNEWEFKERTKRVALRVIRLVDALPKSRAGDVIGRQILRSGTSIGANYRAACRGVSRADVISRLGDVEEETDETLYWLELLAETGIVSEAKLADLINEVNEILSMTVASIRTLKANGPRRRVPPRRSISAESKIQNLKSKIGFTIAS